MAGEKIIDFLSKKGQQGFNGCVKMVFEDGKMTLMTEANSFEYPRSKIFSQKTILGLVAATEEPGFCGTIVFSFNHGTLESYSYMRTWRGKSLEAALNGEKGETK